MRRALPGLVAAALLLLVTPAAARAQANITLSPNAASLLVDETQDFTAVVTGTNKKDVKWMVCNGKGHYCLAGGSSAVGTVVEVGQDADGNPIARYTAPSTAPKPTLCVVTGGGCRVVLKAKLKGKRVRAKAEVILFARPLAITTDWLPYGILNRSYGATLQATGGTGQYAWSLIGGALPPGVSFYPSIGEFYGFPSQASTFSLTIQVADQGVPQQVWSRDLSITITRDLYIQPTVLRDGLVGQPYSNRADAQGGQSPYTWLEPAGFFDASGAGTPGTPCEGLTLNLASTNTRLDAGGTPVRSGTCGPFVYQVMDSSDPPEVFGRQWSFPVYDPLAITTTSLPDASTDAVYEFTPQGTGGKLPYTWYGIALPEGLAMDSQTGRISGAPQVAGTFDVTLQLLDRLTPSQLAQQPLTLTVHPGEPPGRNDSIATATRLVSGRFRASISPYPDPATGLPRSDNDYYWMTANAGDIVGVWVVAQGLYPPSPLDSVLEVLDENGRRYTACRSHLDGAPDPTPDAFDDLCLSDDTIYDTDSYFQFLVPGTLGTPVTFYLHVFDFRGDARPDFRYEILVIVYPPL